MQKWEYRTISMLNSYGMQYRMNGEKQHQWKDKQIHEILADMGHEGWEFISFDGENYIFKRGVVSQHASPANHVVPHIPQQQPTVPHTPGGLQRLADNAPQA